MAKKKIKNNYAKKTNVEQKCGVTEVIQTWNRPFNKKTQIISELLKITICYTQEKLQTTTYKMKK